MPADKTPFLDRVRSGPHRHTLLFLRFRCPFFPFPGRILSCCPYFRLRDSQCCFFSYVLQKVLPSSLGHSLHPPLQTMTSPLRGDPDFFEWSHGFFEDVYREPQHRRELPFFLSTVLPTYDGESFPPPPFFFGGSRRRYPFTAHPLVFALPTPLPSPTVQRRPQLFSVAWLCHDLIAQSYA